MKKLLTSLVVVGTLAGCAHGHVDPVIAGAVVGAGVGYVASQHGRHVHRPVYVPPPHPVYIPPPRVYAPPVYIPAPPPVIVYPQHRPYPYFRY